MMGIIGLNSCKALKRGSTWLFILLVPFLITEWMNEWKLNLYKCVISEKFTPRFDYWYNRGVISMSSYMWTFSVLSVCILHCKMCGLFFFSGLHFVIWRGKIFSASAHVIGDGKMEAGQRNWSLFKALWVPRGTCCPRPRRKDHTQWWQILDRRSVSRDRRRDV